jgi:hypothetical protein
MPYCYLYQCPRCELDVEVAVAREFYTTPAGERADYDYPAKELYEWPPKLVAGLWSRLWCPQCRAIRPYILLELPEPTENPAHAFFSAEARGLRGDETGPCPECGTTLTLDPEGAPCPRCGEGRLEILGEYEP